jgi:hypothetical protein
MAEAVVKAVEGAAPGVAALLDGVSEDRSHAVLDLGPAADLTLCVYCRFARWIRFADLLGDAGWPRTGGAAAALASIPAQAVRPYDLVFAWDVLDRLFPEDRPRVLERLVELTGPGARLHMVVRADDTLAYPLRFKLLDVNRIRYEPTIPTPLPRPRLLPAEVARLLSPFRVLHAFTLRNGLREYVAARPEG